MFGWQNKYYEELYHKVSEENDDLHRQLIHKECVIGSYKEHIKNLDEIISHYKLLLDDKTE